MNPKSKKPTRGGARPGAGRPRTTGRGRGSGRAITLRVSDAEDAALTAAAGGDLSAVGRYLRDRGLASPAQLAIDALFTVRTGSVAKHTRVKPIPEAPAVRCRLVGSEEHEDGSATLHLDVGGTAQDPEWRVVIEVPASNAGPRAGKE